MQTFTDITDRKWTVNVTVGTIKRVKMRLGIDMLDVQTFLKQMQDIVTLCDLLYVVCQDEADKLGISDEQFAERLAGTTLREARDAIMEAYIAFMPDPEAAGHLRVIKDKYNVLGNKMLAVIEKKMPQITKKIDSEIQNVLVKLEKNIDSELTDGGLSTNSPVSSVSTRPRSRSAN